MSALDAARVPELAVARSRARAASAAPSDTTASSAVAFAVHDAKNLLAALRANVDFVRASLHRANVAPDVAEALDDVDGCCQRLTGLIREAMLASRGEAPTPTLTRVHPADLVREAAARARRRAESRSIRLQTLADESLVASLDVTLIGRVLDNLLDNALRHARRGGRVVVRCAARDGELALSVADDGAGVAPRIAPHLFEPYVTSATAAHDREVALRAGLGLAFCRAVVTAHGGTIHAKNRAAGGALFVARLPLATRERDSHVALRTR